MDGHDHCVIYKAFLGDKLHMHWLLDGDQFPWIATERVDVTSKEAKKLTAAKHYDIPRTIQYQLTQAHGTDSNIPVEI